MTMLLSNIDPLLYAIGLATLLLIYMPFSPMLIDILLLPRGLQVAIYRYRRLLWAVVWACAIVLLIRGLNAIETPAGFLSPVTGAVKAALGSWGPAVFGAGDPVWITATLITAAVAALMFWSGYVPYVMTPPTNPRLLSTADADELLSDEDMVLGTVANGEAHAYPRDYIARPHFFEDTVGGTPLTISYCILCNSGIAFKPEIKGRSLKLKCVTAYNNNIIYYDPEGGNYIQQLDGVFHGPDKGTQLEAHPVIQASWGEWKKLHPDTKLYYAPEKTLRDKMVGAMLQMMIPVRKLAGRKKPWHRIRGELDGRLPAMSYVYALEHNGERKAYSQDTLAQAPVVNDTVGGTPILVAYDRARDIGDIFARTLDGRTLTFEPAAEGEAIARDRETGSLWSIAGSAISGELQGKSLTRVPHYNKIFWFSWPLFKPGTVVGPAAAEQA